MKTQDIISDPGTYAILMKLPSKKKIRVGKLGTFEFNKGYYVYVGSAFGPGGIRARLGRHLKDNKKLKWHIDYIREYMEVIDIQFAKTAKNEECAWGDKIVKTGAITPVKKLGSSDCKCYSHLFFFQKINNWNEFINSFL